tara:strand:- start:513 stop:707 length:195 start_codon:yes stop_codon:yes gene_type:complete
MPGKITSKSGGSRKRAARRKTQKRGKNQFFKTMLDAKKKGLKSFKYNGKTYHKHKKGGLIYYKA